MKAIVIAGPTACGKSDFAVSLAGYFSGEIVSADSRQVFRFMDLGTGKVKGKLSPSYEIMCCDSGFETADLQQNISKNTGLNGNGTEELKAGLTLNPFISDGIPHWLIDIFEPGQPFSVAQYQRLALCAMKDISRRGKLPFIVGGTGLYIRALTEGLVFPDIFVSDDVRENVRLWDLQRMQSEILKIQSDAGDYIDLKNPRRVARGLELLLSGLPSLADMRKTAPTGFLYLVLGLKYPKAELESRIRLRLDLRLKEGMIAEVEGLLAMGISPQRLYDFGLEYRYLSLFVLGRISYDQMYERLYFEICHFAKRQMTWFNKYSNVVWVDNLDTAAKLISDFL